MTLPLADLRLRARVLRDLVTLVFVALAFAFAVILASLLRGFQLGMPLLSVAPLVFYLGAVWMVRTALSKIAAGGAFDRVVARMLGRVGAALVLGALTNVFFVQWIIRAINGRGAYAMFDPAAITLGVVGFTLLLVANLLAQAADMRAELDEIV